MTIADVAIVRAVNRLSDRLARLEAELDAGEDRWAEYCQVAVGPDSSVDRPGRERAAGHEGRARRAARRQRENPLTPAEGGGARADGAEPDPRPEMEEHARPREGAVTRRQAAREARRQVEKLLDALGGPWPWHLGASRLIDLWLVVEESSR
jgi:hypothetical protein